MIGDSLLGRGVSWPDPPGWGGGRKAHFQFRLPGPPSCEPGHEGGCLWAADLDKVLVL